MDMDKRLRRNEWTREHRRTHGDAVREYERGWRERNREKLRERRSTAEFRAYNAERMRRYYAESGVRRTPEFRAKNAERMRRYYAEHPEARAKSVERQRERRALARAGGDL